MLASAKKRIIDAVGGPAWLQVILVLGAVLGLDAADKGTVSAVSDQLEPALHIGNTEVGLLLSVVSFATAFAAPSMGVLADRLPRRLVLTVAVASWSIAMALCASATSYLYLLLVRLLLGAVTAAAWPCVASLCGDFFPARQRAGIFGLILSGELIGAGVGFFISGEVSTLFDWRWSFVAMAVPAVVLAWVVWRYLPEPARGEQGWLEAGERDPAAASHPAHRRRGTSGKDALSKVHEAVLKAEVQPRKQLVLRQDPTRWDLWRTMRYLLRVPSYALLIVASTLVYFYFTGFRAFAMIYFTAHYHLPRSIVSALVFVLGIGAIVGLVAGGRISEGLLRRGNLNARIIVPGIALFASVPLLGCGIWTSHLWLGLPVLMLGMAALAAAIAPIDAARLDIVHPRLWGRGEAGRMSLRSLFEGAAPLLFGALSTWLGGEVTGLEWTFLIMLIPMGSAGFFLLPGQRTYPRDVATAAASVKATRQVRHD